MNEQLNKHKDFGRHVIYFNAVPSGESLRRPSWPLEEVYSGAGGQATSLVSHCSFDETMQLGVTRIALSRILQALLHR